MDRDEIKECIKTALENGQLEEAAQIIEQYKKIIGYDDDVAGMEAILEIYNGNYDNAMLCIQKGLEHNIFNSDLYFTMGNIYEAAGKYNNAYLCYEHALTLSTENAEYIIETVHNLRSNHDVHVRNYSIILLTYNKLEYTKVCIDSIRKYNGNEGCEIIVVDNNSTDGTVEYLKQQSDIKYILNDYNNGFPGGCNQGIGIADKNNDIFLLNNDTVIMANSIFNLRMGLYDDEKIGATGSVSNSVSNYQMITEKFDDFNGYIDFAMKNNITDYRSYEKRMKLVGFAMFIKRDVLDKVGYLDETFTPGNFEDDDLSIRIIEAGYDLVLCKDSYIHHFGSTSFKDNVESYNKLLSTNAKKFADKWGFKIEKEANIRYDLINLISKSKNEAFNILQIGCGCGATLQMIKNIYPNANVYGVDKNVAVLKIASMVGDVRCEDIEKQELSFEEKMFDYIILGNVLEKVLNPACILNKLKKYLKSSGEILAGITNVMNYSVIAGLLNGEWNYSDYGIMDRDNIRYFTLKEISKLFENTEYNITSISGNSNVTREEEIKFINNLVSLGLSEDKSQFETSQYLIKAKKSNKDLERQMKYVLRRIEFDVDVDESNEEFLNLVRENDIDTNSILDVVARDIIDKIYILNYVAILFYNNKMYDYILPMLNAAYELDNNNIDTNYNLAYILDTFGNKELALDYLYKLNTNDEQIILLMNEIRG